MPYVGARGEGLGVRVDLESKVLHPKSHVLKFLRSARGHSRMV